MAEAWYGRIFNPFWAETVAVQGWGLNGDNTIASGLTFVTSPAHPLATGLGERWVQVDPSVSSFTAVVVPNTQNSASFGAGLPSGFSGVQGAVRYSYLFRVNSTTPPEEIRLMLFGNGGTESYRLSIDTERRLKLYVGGVLYGWSYLPVAVDTNYQLEVWAILEDKNGVTLTDHYQIVVRLISDITGARTATTYINVNVPKSIGGSTTNPFGNSITMGDVTTPASGFKWYFGNLYIAYEDATDPYGIIRVDWMKPNGISALLNEWTTTAAAADVDEDTPDDATTSDTDTISNANSPESQLYTFPDPTNIVSADEVISVNVWLRVNADAPPKGSSSSMTILCSDGTDVDTGGSITANGAWSTGFEVFDEEPGAAHNSWSFADLQVVEAGLQGGTNNAVALNFFISTVSLFIPYQKDGETTEAIPTESLFRQRRPVRHRPPFEPPKRRKRGFLQAGTLFLQTLTGALSGFAGALTKSTGKNAAGALSGGTGAITKQTNKSFVADVTVGPGDTDPDAVYRRSLGGTLSGWISGTLTTLKIFNPAGLINILQRLRRRGDH